MTNGPRRAGHDRTTIGDDTEELMTMMWWYGDAMTGWGFALMIIGPLVFWSLAVAAAVAAVRYLGGRGRAEPGTPEGVLADRFARGEIDEAEYRSRLDTLHPAAGPIGGL